jgi:hypothetical protein
MAEFDTSTVVGADGSVRQVEWCGNDAILVTWESLAVLVGPFGDTLQYVRIISEILLSFISFLGTSIQVQRLQLQRSMG